MFILQPEKALVCQKCVGNTSVVICDIKKRCAKLMLGNIINWGKLKRLHLSPLCRLNIMTKEDLFIRV